MVGFEADLRMLELDLNASREDVKQAYKDLVVVWHPDRFEHNPRLRQKAEEKLKGFNLAYEHLKGWRPTASVKPNVRRSPSTTVEPVAEKAQRQQTQWRSPRAQPRPSRPPQAQASSTRSTHPWISLAEAEFILKRYHFESLAVSRQSTQRFQGGPFVLAVCESPPEVMISVPCDSVWDFDRILFAIPCKSMGHFRHHEAEQLLHLLHTQADCEPSEPPQPRANRTKSATGRTSQNWASW